MLAAVPLLALVFPALSIFISYLRFKDTHLQHHFDPALTDPYDDPESNYMDPAVWARLSPVMQGLCRINNTLAGRMVIGPVLDALWPEANAEEILATLNLFVAVFSLGLGRTTFRWFLGLAFAALIAAGLNDWGGVSPVTPDHVNPEAPWPHLELLRKESALAGKRLAQRLPIYPEHIEQADRWLDPAFRKPILTGSNQYHAC